MCSTGGDAVPSRERLLRREWTARWEDSAFHSTAKVSSDPAIGRIISGVVYRDLFATRLVARTTPQPYRHATADQARCSLVRLR